MTAQPDLASEWLETDGLGGFASGTVAGWRSRRYHGLLVAAVDPPTRRAVLVAGAEVWVDTPDGSWALSSQRYHPDVTHPNGHEHLTAFTIEPWPTWTFRLPDGRAVVQELALWHGGGAAVLRWRLDAAADGVTLRVRPLLAGRDSHALHVENDVLDMGAAVEGADVRWRPYGSLPAVLARSNGAYRHDPLWFRRFLLEEERARGFEHREDLASPGELTFSLDRPALLVLAAEGVPRAEELPAGSAEATADRLLVDEQRRRATFASPLARAADAFIVARDGGRTVIAGYPWFTDWGRDTLIAMRGLCLASGRWTEARAILTAWAATVSEGMLPNRFVEAGDEPEFNAVDASLWFVVVVHELLAAAAEGALELPDSERESLVAATEAIIEGYQRGTRYGIRVDGDGLVAAGAEGVQLTWMDARLGDWVVTPRRGKPVEIQALWVNALRLAGDPRWEHAAGSFSERFWNAELGCLYDVVDVDGVPGAVDASVRPNQILAVGGLPFPLLDGARACAVVDLVEERLWTPLGLRTLDPADPRYAGRYEGGPLARDGSYHQGPAWAWLLGPFVDAWLAVQGRSDEAKREARERFLTPLQEHLSGAGLGHVSELADGDAPFTPRGCPFQAWSLGELIRIEAMTDLRAGGRRSRAEVHVAPSVATPSR